MWGSYDKLGSSTGLMCSTEDQATASHWVEAPSGADGPPHPASASCSTQSMMPNHSKPSTYRQQPSKSCQVCKLLLASGGACPSNTSSAGQPQSHPGAHSPPQPGSAAAAAPHQLIELLQLDTAWSGLISFSTERSTDAACLHLQSQLNSWTFSSAEKHLRDQNVVCFSNSDLCKQAEFQLHLLSLQNCRHLYKWKSDLRKAYSQTSNSQWRIAKLINLQNNIF